MCCFSHTLRNTFGFDMLTWYRMRSSSTGTLPKIRATSRKRNGDLQLTGQVAYRWLTVNAIIERRLRGRISGARQIEVLTVARNLFSILAACVYLKQAVTKYFILLFSMSFVSLLLLIITKRMQKGCGKENVAIEMSPNQGGKQP